MKNDALSALIDNFGPTTQYLLLGDSDHDNLAIAKTVSDPQTLKAMKDAGFENLMIEYFEDSRNLFDAYANQRITRDQFKDILGTIIKPATNGVSAADKLEWAANLLDNARAAGLHVIPVDGGEGYYDATLANEEIRRTYSRMIDVASQSPDIKISRSLYLETRESVREDMKVDGSYEELRYKRKPPSEQTQLDRLDEFQIRMALDPTSLAPRIHALADGKPSVVFYGGAHIAKKQDLDETLKTLHERDNPASSRSATTVINLYGKNDPYDAGLVEMKGVCRDFNCASHPEHINLYLENGNMDTGNKGVSPSLLPAPIQ